MLEVTLVRHNGHAKREVNGLWMHWKKPDLEQIRRKRPLLALLMRVASGVRLVRSFIVRNILGFVRSKQLVPYRLLSVLNLSHASLSVLNTAALIMRCSVVASVGIWITSATHGRNKNA